ncbi:hypothetical protein E4T66_17920 [Sinimarinibacterium sp. CAU 1509]|uniref:hypothetical protein n=1 Tax=Sinimarinibacterium sp. CAU 1509 TaxID=2562283 RepID=UPI0010AC7C2B|nr:hypothetical protein [Sinimarinibacterium sp. CAU 1509]TJY57283.1 hypothetical protein E4T66_17920 [Sinimarinibacterium sp. CAU 1509]
MNVELKEEQLDIFGVELSAPVKASSGRKAAVVSDRVIPGSAVGRIALSRLLIELWFVREVVSGLFYRMFDSEALEPSDCIPVQSMRADLAVSNLEDSVKVLEVVDRYSTAFVDRLLAVDESARLAVLKHSKGFGKSFGDMEPAEYIEAVTYCRDELAPRYFDLFESGSADAAAKKVVRDALLAISPWRLPARLNPVEAFIRLVPEVVTADLFESFFDWRRKGETLRNVTKNETRRQKRAAAAAEREAAKAEAAEPKLRNRPPTWEELGVSRGKGDWSMTWKKRQAFRDPSSVFKPQPLPMVRPRVWVEPTPVAERVVEVPGQCDYFVLREYEARVFALEYRVRTDAGTDVLVDSMSIEGAGGDWNRTRVTSVLRSQLRDPLLGVDGSAFPVELLKFDRVGIAVYIDEADMRSEVERALDSAVNADNGTGLSTTWSAA